ncbi:MAG: hypothetical protein RL653_2963 [Pseudomonadota bacterium]|jgi:putative ABC transport system permease protein
MNSGGLSGAGTWSRWRTMAGVGIRMMFHDRLKLLGTLTGVVFACLLSNQQAGTFLGLLGKNVMFIENASADVWIAPPFTRQFQGGKLLSDAVLNQARATPGVDWAEPLLLQTAQVQLPTGGSEPVSLVGTRAPRFAGGPWNLVAGDASVLTQPLGMIFEDSEREKVGGLNLGSVREVNGHRVQARGFTWGLLPFGPAYAFAEETLAREVLGLPADKHTFILVGAAHGQSPEALAEELQRRLPQTKVMTRGQYRGEVIKYLLTATAIGISFGTSTLFGLLVGFVTVALSMFSSVIDNIRQFGTLKAIGATTWDLAKLLFVQSCVYALTGSVIGLFLVTRIAEVSRNPNLAIILPPWLLASTAGMMVLLCVSASFLSLLRLRKLEPAMVFR